MDLSIGDLVWVRYTVIPPGSTNNLLSEWKLGTIVDDKDYQAGLYKVHVLEYNIIQKHFINDIRILEHKATIYESRREAK